MGDYSAGGLRGSQNGAQTIGVLPAVGSDLFDAALGDHCAGHGQVMLPRDCDGCAAFVEAMDRAWAVDHGA
jgi:hypothetical protein